MGKAWLVHYNELRGRDDDVNYSGCHGNILPVGGVCDEGCCLLTGTVPYSIPIEEMGIKWK